jgi:hypothetical protein
MDRYTLVRRPEHATLGDAAERYQRDPDAFTAGAQYALDVLLSRNEDTLKLYGLDKLVVGSAADVLTQVHDGRL